MGNELEKFADKIKQQLGTNLESFIVYGSAATGERYKDSDYNTLVVVKKLDLKRMKGTSKTVRKWVRKGNPVPLIFTHDRILKSDDVFPLEFSDIKENHRVVCGRDVFKNIKINNKNLRLELERELKSKILRLRQAYVMTGGKKNEVKKLLTNSLSTFIALIKGVIRLYGKKPPSLKKKVIAEIPDKIKIDRSVFYRILTLKEGNDNINPGEYDALFESYIREIGKIADVVDKKKR